MHPERHISFVATPSSTRLSEGKIRYQGQIQHNQVLDVKDTRKRFADYMNDRSGLSGYYLEGLGRFIAEQIAMGYRLDFGPFAVGLKMRGGLPAANAPFDPKVNRIAVEMMPSKDIKKATMALNPVNATLDDYCHIFGNWQQTPYNAKDEIASDGERLFVTGGWRILVHPSASDEGVWIENDLGVKLLGGTVTEADNGRVVSTFTGHIDPGLYWFVVVSRHKVTGELLRAQRRITAR